jgi:hypothetical protein
MVLPKYDPTIFKKKNDPTRIPHFPLIAHTSCLSCLHDSFPKRRRTTLRAEKKMLGVLNSVLVLHNLQVISIDPGGQEAEIFRVLKSGLPRPSNFFLRNLLHNLHSKDTSLQVISIDPGGQEADIQGSQVRNP